MDPIPSCGMVGGKREVTFDGRLVCAERKERGKKQQEKNGGGVVVILPPFLIPLGCGAYIEGGGEMLNRRSLESFLV